MRAEETARPPRCDRADHRRVARYETVVVNLYRPGLGRLHGHERARRTDVAEALIGQVRSVAEWDTLVCDRFLRRGAYVVPAGELRLAAGRLQLRASAEPIAEPAADDWQPEDALFLPMRHSDGHLLGILSVDEPASRKRATDEELDVLVVGRRSCRARGPGAQEAAEAAAPPARARAAAGRVVATDRRAGRGRDPARRLPRRSRRARLPARRRPADPPGDGRLEARAAVGWDLDGARAELGVRLRRRRAAARPGVRGVGLLPAAERRGRGAALARQPLRTSRIATVAGRTRGTATGCSSRSTTARAP